MKTMIISRTIETFENYFSSPELLEIYRGYENNISPKKAVAAESEFLAGYVVEVDPASNYGKPFKLFRHYITKDGVKHLKEERINSCLSNAPLQLVEITEDKINLLEFWFEKTKASREHLAQHKLTTI